ncbi:MAG: phosphatidylglycerol lysyltransferase domain-containing protein [Candidatus Woykebacteria bacterium]
MIPKFPHFKKLELADKAEIEHITRKYPPYSDFNFISMWSWDTKGEIRICELNGNLLVRFTDYVTSEPFYSFIGTNNVNETAYDLVKLAKSEGFRSELKLLPEISVEGIDKDKFIILEDKNNFDYVLLIHPLRLYNTQKTRSRKKSVRQLLERHSCETRIIDLSDSNQRKEIEVVFKKWSKHKDQQLTELEETSNELLAMRRLIDKSKKIKFIPIGIYIDNKLAGFCFSEVLNDGFATSHFWKVNPEISTGLYAYLMQENARILSEKGCEFINIEQDLGLPNLRKWKNSYDLHINLKKYILISV